MLTIFGCMNSDAHCFVATNVYILTYIMNYNLWKLNVDALQIHLKLSWCGQHMTVLPTQHTQMNISCNQVSKWDALLVFMYKVLQAEMLLNYSVIFPSYINVGNSQVSVWWHVTTYTVQLTYADTSQQYKTNTARLYQCNIWPMNIVQQNLSVL